MPFEQQTWDNIDRRKQDAPQGLIALKIATRASEGTPLSGDKMFEDAGDSEKKYVRQSDLTNRGLQSTVNRLLTTANESIKIQEYISELVDVQYQGALETLTTFNLDNLKKLQKNKLEAPTLDQTKEILARQITFEQLEVIKNMKNPTLQLIPPITSMGSYIQALDSNKPMEGQVDAFVSEWHKEAFSRADKSKGDAIIGWEIAITEGEKEPDLLKGEDVNMTLRERSEPLSLA